MRLFTLPSMRMRAVGLPCLLAALLLVLGCAEHFVVGEHVLVEWEGDDYPAVILAVEGPARYRVHFDGYDSIWDESVNVSRIKKRVSGPVAAPPPPAKVLRRGGSPAPANSADAALPSRHKVGSHVRVQWHGAVYPATIVAALGQERYRVHYEGFGPEWDEDVSLARIVSPK